MFIIYFLGDITYYEKMVFIIGVAKKNTIVVFVHHGTMHFVLLWNLLFNSGKPNATSRGGQRKQ